jgi:hypothetical protein
VRQRHHRELHLMVLLGPQRASVALSQAMGQVGRLHWERRLRTRCERRNGVSGPASDLTHLSPLLLLLLLRGRPPPRRASSSRSVPLLTPLPV